MNWKMLAIALGLLCLGFPRLAQELPKSNDQTIRVFLTPGSTEQTGQVVEVLYKSCTNVNVTILKDKADYFLEASNVHPDVRFVLFNKEGDAVFLAAPHHPDNATRDICKYLGRLK
jgi:hypothetical protein